MHIPGLLSLLLSSTLAAPGPTPTAPTRSAGTELELEVIDRSAGTTSSFGFVVPVDGSVQASIDRSGDPQRCEVEVHPVHVGLRVKLRCMGNPVYELRVEATRRFATGKRIRLAEVSRPGGATSQVFVTLR